MFTSPISKLMFMSVLTLAASVGAAGGCGGGSIPIDELADEAESALCDRYVACGDAPDKKTCTDATFVERRQSLVSAVAAVKRGTIVYDGAAARECLDALRSSCDILTLFDESCGRTVVGTIAAGGACAISEECVGGGYCERPSGCSDACCIGTCTAAVVRARVGESCAGGGGCAYGAFCQDGTCVAQLATGAACSDSGACQLSDVCKRDATGGAGTCVAGAGEGETCETAGFIRCRSEGNYCDPTSLRCTRVGQVGDACSVELNNCAAYATCKDGVCVAFPTAGQPCDGTLLTNCYLDLVCDAGVCAAPPPATACVVPGR